MTRREIRDRILRALRSGPMVDIQLAVYVGAPLEELRDVLIDLRDEEQVIRNYNTWRLI